MFDAIRGELIKLKGSSSLRKCFLCGLVLDVVLMAAVVLYNVNKDEAFDDLRELDVRFGLATTLTRLFLAALFAFGAYQVSTAFRDRSIEGGLLAVPNRSNYAVARMSALAIVGVLFGIVTMALNMVAVAIGLNTADRDLPFGDVRMWRAAAVVVAGYGLIVAAGAGVGFLVRTSPVGVCVCVAAPFVCEPVIGALRQQTANYLPFHSLIDAAQPVGEFNLFGPGPSLALFAGFALLVAGAGVAVFARRSA